MRNARSWLLQEAHFTPAYFAHGEWRMPIIPQYQATTISQGPTAPRQKGCGCAFAKPSQVGSFFSGGT
jgi:hypothetical protein